MSKSIHDVTLLELLPQNLAASPEIIALGKAIDKQWQKLAGKIKNVLTIADICNASPAVLDMLAVEMNIDFYDSNLPLAKRRALVKNGYLYKYRKGTAYAVKQIVSDAYDMASAQEWFDYGGAPYHFRIATEARLPDEETINKIFSAVKAVKNVRSTLDYLGAIKKIGKPLYYGFAVYQRHYQKIQ
jgi:phage tail P2-like protein